MHHSLDSALAGPRPDLAIVATPHDSHAPLAERLLQARVPTLLEKPPARSAPELATLLRLSQDLRTPLATSLPLHYDGRCRRFMDLLRSGNLTGAEVNIRAGVPIWVGADGWRLSRERAGGGVLIDLGYHYLELLVACLGPPDSKSVLLTRSAGTRCEVEGEARVSLWFAEKRLHTQLWFRSGSGVKKGSELSIRQQGVLLYHSSASGPTRGAAGQRRARGASSSATAVAQLKALVSSGFMDGMGDWQRALRRQHEVMLLLDDLYAGAELTASLPATAGVPNMPRLTDLTGLPAETLAADLTGLAAKAAGLVGVPQGTSGPDLTGLSERIPAADLSGLPERTPA